MFSIWDTGLFNSAAASCAVTRCRSHALFDTAVDGAVTALSGAPFEQPAKQKRQVTTSSFEVIAITLSAMWQIEFTPSRIAHLPVSFPAPASIREVALQSRRHPMFVIRPHCQGLARSLKSIGDRLFGADIPTRFCWVPDQCRIGQMHRGLG